MKKADTMKPNESDTENFIRIVLADAYWLREEWGDPYVPVTVVRWCRRMESSLNMTPSPALDNGYTTRKGINSWKKKLIEASEREDKKRPSL